MSGALRTVGTIAGVVALAATGVGAFASAATLAKIGATLGASVATIGKVATAVAVISNVGAQLTAKKPIAQGSSNQITIGANMPSPMILGESYYGGNRVHLVGYGTENDVPNAYLLAVDIYGVGGPYEELVATYGDFTAISFDGSGKAIGHYSNNTLYRDYQLGATPESSALTPHWSGAPDWGTSYKLSGKAAIAWNARFPKDGKRFGSGFFQTGAVWKGIKLYDPRLDSTYPGGSGSQRWDDPSDTTSFATAKATWTYSQNPGLHGLRYALGTWERNESTGDPYQKVFGIGLDWDGIIVEDFVELANVCDDNGWTCNGVIQEPGDKWANLKSILQAGGAEPCFKGGKLGLRINAPRVSLDTITRDDLADGEITAPGMLSYRDRLNTIVPKYRSPNHKWEYVATQEVIQVTEYVTEDGEEKSEERQYNLVTDPTQAAQLAAYDLVAGRERGPIELPCKPRLRQYSPGDLLTLDIPEAGLEGDYIILQRSVDPATMVVNLTLVSEDPDKHAYALAQTGTMPPAVTIQGPSEVDGVASGPDTILINGGFDTDAIGWGLGDGAGTLVSTSGEGVLSASGSYVIFAQPITTVIGQSYDVAGEIVGVTGAPGYYAIRKADNAACSVNVVAIQESATGTFSTSFTATEAVTYICLQVNGAGTSAVFDDLTVTVA